MMGELEALITLLRSSTCAEFIINHELWCNDINIRYNDLHDAYKELQENDTLIINEDLDFLENHVKIRVEKKQK